MSVERGGGEGGDDDLMEFLLLLLHSVRRDAANGSFCCCFFCCCKFVFLIFVVSRLAPILYSFVYSPLFSFPSLGLSDLGRFFCGSSFFNKRDKWKYAACNEKGRRQ